MAKTLENTNKGRFPLFIPQFGTREQAPLCIPNTDTSIIFFAIIVRT
jgi:hypothetical protein